MFIRTLATAQPAQDQSQAVTRDLNIQGMARWLKQSGEVQ